MPEETYICKGKGMRVCSNYNSYLDLVRGISLDFFFFKEMFPSHNMSGKRKRKQGQTIADYLLQL